MCKQACFDAKLKSSIRVAGAPVSPLKREGFLSARKWEPSAGRDGLPGLERGPPLPLLGPEGLASLWPQQAMESQWSLGRLLGWFLAGEQTLWGSPGGVAPVSPRSTSLPAPPPCCSALAAWASPSQRCLCVHYSQSPKKTKTPPLPKGDKPGRIPDSRSSWGLPEAHPGCMPRGTQGRCR